MNSYKEIMDNQLKLDDTFRFSCQQCGNCCRNRGDIIINGLDLFKISKRLRISMSSAINKFCKPDFGDQSGLPILLLGTKPYDNVCVFLRNGKCAIHDSKPGVCAVFPLGRGFNIITNEILYFLTPDNNRCGNNCTYTVREWLNAFGLSEKDEDFIAWCHTITHISKFINGQKARGKKLTFEMLSAIISALYFDFDIDHEYSPQLLENASHLWSKLMIQPPF